MPVHDWTRVSAGIFHSFHHEWISEFGRALNRGLLPPEYYALAEQQVAGFGPDILTLQRPDAPAMPDEERPADGSTGLLLAPPRARFTAETATELAQRKKSTLVVRHISGDRVVAVIEIVSPGNKSSQHALQSLISKACELLEARIHLLLIDLFPPTKRDPEGIHARLWESLGGDGFSLPADKPLTLAAYEAGTNVKAFIEPVAVGDALPPVPLFLEPGAHILLPAEPIYQAAFTTLPSRWQQAL